MEDLCLVQGEARTAARRHVTRILLLTIGLAVAAVAAFGLSEAAAQGTTIEVTTSDDGALTDAGVDCPAANGDECTLRAAVAVADDGDTITFATGINPQLSEASGLRRIDIGGARSITIQGNQDNGEPGTVISGGEPDTDDYGYQLFGVEGGTAVSFRDVVLTGGSISGAGVQGGAIENLGDLTIIGSVVRDNEAEATSSAGSLGGAIYNGPSASLTVAGSLFEDNRAPGLFGINDNPFGQGGAIYNDNGVVEIVGSEFRDNVASNEGGAISSEGGSSVVTISGSQLVANQAGVRGGAIHAGSGADIILEASVLEGNRAEPHDDRPRPVSGGAVYAGTSVQVTVRLSEVVGNESRLNGGAVFSTGGTVVFDRSTVRGNQARRGGALNGFAGSVFVLDASTFSGNVADNPGSAPGRGGVLWQDAVGTLTVTNSTLSGNVADEGGALWLSGSSITTTVTHTTIVGNAGEGILQFGDFIDAVSGSLTPGSSTMTIAHSIIADNSGGDCGFTPLDLEGDGASPLASDGYNLDSDGTCAIDPTDQTVGDVMLGDLADNGGPTLTHLPLEASPAINGGLNPTCLLDVDQRGEPRPAPDSGACDIGAVEVQPVVEETPEEEPDDEPEGEPDDAVEELPETGPAQPVVSDPDFTG